MSGSSADRGLGPAYGAPVSPAAPAASFGQAADRIDRVVALAMRNMPLDEAAVETVTACAPGDLPLLLAGASLVRREHFRDDLHLCAIVNAKSGACTEDCAFCAQSARHKTESPRHDFLDPAEIARAAEAMRACGASRFGIVASGLAPTEAEFEKLLEAVRLVRGLGLAADVSVGILGRERLQRLKAAGLSGVHHNLEVARSFFPQVCTTHDYEDDVEAVRLALAEGFFVCSGGIFGLGETWAHRAELARTLRELGVSNVPMNFLMPIAGTRMENRPALAADEALRIIALYRFMLPTANLRICGGRGLVFGPADSQAELFRSGATGIMVGDYLTTAGTPASADLDLARRLGLNVVRPEAEPTAGLAAGQAEGQER